MTSFGRPVESFGRPGARDEDPSSGASVSSGTAFIDIKINPASLKRLQEELTRAVCAAVEAGFAQAGAMDQPEQL